MQPNSYTTRPAQMQDAESLANLFQLTYGASSHPFQEVANVQRFLRNEKNIYVVGIHEGRVIAGMGLTAHDWHDAFEWSMGVTHPFHRRAGLAEILMQQAYQILSSRRQGDLLYGYPRVRRIYEVGLKCFNPPLRAIGHDGGMNVANGTRETHLLICARLPHARFHHVTPPVADLTDSPVVREAMWHPMGLRANPGEYPTLNFVGPQPTGKPQPKDSQFSYSFAPTCRSGALELRGYAGHQTQPRQISRALEAFLSAFPTAQHISAHVLADKTHLIREMREMGFAITAYLPAWFKSGNARYDCVKLVKRRFTKEPIANGFEPLIASLQAQFASLFTHRQALGVNA